MALKENELLFLEYLEEGHSIQEIAQKMDVSYSWARTLAARLKDEIVARARDRLAVSSMQAAITVEEMLNADSNTEKGELRLAAAEKIMDRVGITKHTNVEVKIESDNGLFILPAKEAVEAPSDDSEE